MRFARARCNCFRFRGRAGAGQLVSTVGVRHISKSERMEEMGQEEEFEGEGVFWWWVARRDHR